MAGRIPASFIDGLLARADIVEVVGRYLPLKQRGRDHWACCPFHEEKTPSFKVDAGKQFYHCFGCGAGGSVIQFLMEHQRLQFVEAVETLAGQYGLEVPREGHGSPRETARFNAVFDALDKAAQFYRAQLAEHVEAANYLKSRGVAHETRDAFHVGYAPPAYGHLKKCFGSDYDETLLVEAGLLARADDRRGAYERLRDRVIFPIRSARGRVVGFGGRLLPGRENPAKYLNSPETRVFKKRETLYGLHELRQARKFERVIVVEGYMDVVSLAQHGVRNAVATLGTATTSAQIRALFKITPRIVFCFDGDRAGGEAAARAAEQALAAFSDGREIAFMFLPEDQDPDDYVRARGAAAFSEASRGAMPLAEFLFRHHGRGLDLSDPAACAKLVGKLQPLLAQLPSQSVFRELMFSKLAEKTGVTGESLRRRQPAPAARRPLPTRRASAQGAPYSTIRVAVRALLEQPRLAVADEWTQAAFDTDDLRRLEKRGARFLADLIDKIKTHKPANTAGVLEIYRGTDEEDGLKRLMASSPPTAVELDRRAELLDAVRRLKKDLDEQDLDKKIARLTAKNEKDGLSEMERKEIARLLSERHRLRSPPPAQG